MKLFTRPELARLRADLDAGNSPVGCDPDLARRLLAQAEYALDCAAVLDFAVHFPAEPYGEAEALVTRLTNDCNEIWNRYRYLGDGAAPKAS